MQNVKLGIVHMPGAAKPWRLTIQDQACGEVLWVDLTDDVAKQIVEKLTTGIQIAKVIPSQ